jgi:crotonobetaine/carnitine-CoA ligase
MTTTYPPLELLYKQPHWSLPVVLQDRAKTHAEKIYLRETGNRARSWTYDETHRDAKAIAAGLEARGYQPGDRVTLMMENCPEYLLTWFGCSLAGIVEAPINQEFSGIFLERVLNLIEPRAVVTTPQYISLFIAVAKRLTCLPEFFIVCDDPTTIVSTIKELAQSGLNGYDFNDLPLDASAFTSRIPAPQDLAAIISTSGTTGPSKGVMMSYAQQYFAAESTRNLMRLSSDDVMPLELPLFHINAQCLTAFSALISGASIVMYEKFSASNFLQRVRRDGLTTSNLMGEMTEWVWQQPVQPDDHQNSLRCVMATPTPASIADGFRSRFGIEAIVEGYGLTETSMQFLVPYGSNRPAGAVGVLCSEYFNVVLADPETDLEVPIGQVGELLVRSRVPWIMSLGYWRNPEATSEARRNLWFHTGDGMRRDQEGWYYFSDRIKDSIRRNGENISSFEVEQALLEHPAVRECAVISVPTNTEARDDDVMAIMALESGTECKEICSWAQANLPRFVVPRYWRVMTELPKTPSAKVRKVELRAENVTPDTLDIGVQS